MRLFTDNNVDWDIPFGVFLNFIDSLILEFFNQILLELLLCQITPFLVFWLSIDHISFLYRIVNFIWWFTINLHPIFMSSTRLFSAQMTRGSQAPKKAQRLAPLGNDNQASKKRTTTSRQRHFFPCLATWSVFPIQSKFNLVSLNRRFSSC